MGPSICCQVSQEDHLHLKIKHMVGRVILLGVPVDVPFGWPLPSVSTEWLRVSQGANWTVPPCQVEWKAKKFWLKWTWRRKLQCLQLDFSTFQCLYLDFPSSCLLLLLLLLILFLCILLLIPFVRDSLHHLFLLLCASDFLRSLAVFFARDVSSHFQVRHLAGVLPQHHSLVWRISLRKIHPWASSSVFRSCKCSDKLINSCKHRNWPKTLSESRRDAKCENEVSQEPRQMVMQVVKALPFKRTSASKRSDKLKWHFDAFSIFLEAPKTPHQLPVANFTLVWWWKQMSRSQRITKSKPQPSKGNERL